MVADKCHVVLSCFWGEKAPRENPPNGNFFVFSHGGRSPRHTKVRHFSCVTSSPNICRIFAWRGESSPREIREKAPRENPPNGDFFMFSHGDLSPRHTKVRDSPCVAFSATVCPIFAWRGERSPCENPLKSPFGGFSRGDISRFHPENTLIRHGTNQPFRVFAWRGERSPRENTKKSPFGGFSRGAFSPRNTIIRNGTNQPPYRRHVLSKDVCTCYRNAGFVDW